MRRFSVWNGTRINPGYRDLRDVRDACYALKPPGRGWKVEWLVKAGEGGTWGVAWDHHSLALDGFGKLLSLIEMGKALRPRIHVVPYVVIRGRTGWNEAEWEQIGECAVASRIVVLNLEPGPSYWGGPIAPQSLKANYLDPMWEHIHQAYGDDPAWKRVYLELAMVPRQWVVNELGGDDDDPATLSTLETWLAAVRGASWQCYGLMADDLDVARSMARVYRWLGDTAHAGKARYRIPIVQRGQIEDWAGSGYARGGLQVWNLDGD